MIYVQMMKIMQYMCIKFSVLSFKLLTTSLVCPSVQGATVHKPRRRVVTAPRQVYIFQILNLDVSSQIRFPLRSNNQFLMVICSSVKLQKFIFREHGHPSGVSSFISKTVGC